MKLEDFVSAAMERGWTLDALRKDGLTMGHSRAAYTFSAEMIEATDDETLLKLLDERTDRIEALERISEGHQVSSEERAHWKHRPAPPLSDEELENLWRRYQHQSDEGRIAARRLDDSITPREFHRLLIEIERLRALVE